VVIQGAGGGVGIFAVQIAKAFGAEVTAVCNPQNVELIRSLGADHIMDYTKEDLTRSGQRYDLILAVNGYHPLGAYRRALRPRGRFVLAGASSDHMTQAVFQTMLMGPLISRVGNKKYNFFICNPAQKDLEFVRGLLEAGKVTPVIDKQYPLPETADALRYMGEGHVRGKVVIIVGQNGQC
jgi:NADPH:quinone reductase-like Zn-dependent oxidoreductase